MKILFLGQNPARLAPDSAFVGSRSGATLFDWIKRSGLPTEAITFANVLDCPTFQNRPLTKREISSAAYSSEFAIKILDADLVFACGKQAEKALEIAANYHDLSIKIVPLPHPSGLNRKLNDKIFVESVIQTMRRSYEGTLFEKMEGNKERGLPSRNQHG